MNSNSVATEIEKQTGLKRSTKTKKYAQETGRGNIAYAMRFAGYRYSGDFHVVKDYGNTFEVITDSPEGESKLNDILQVLNNLGLEIVAQGRTHISFKIPLDENKWYGADGSYRKGKWKLYKRWNKDGEYALYNDDDENFVHNITAYTPSQAKYSADYFIEQFEKGEIMNSKNQTVVRQGPNLKTLDETPAEHIMKNLDAYKGYTRYDMEQLVLNPSGYTLYDGNNRNAVYKKDGAEDITLLFRNGELKDAKITSSHKPIKSAKILCKKGSAKLIEHCEAGEYGYLGRYTIIIDGKEVYNFTAENRREAVCSFNNYLDYKMNYHINNSHKSIKSDYSDEEYWYPETKKVWVVYAMNPRTGRGLGKWEWDSKEEAEEQVNGWRKTATFYYWIKEEEKKIQSSRKPIKSSKSVCIGFNTENGTLLWKRDDLYTLDGSSIRQTKQKDIADRWIEKYNLNTTDTERLDKYTQEGIGQIPWGLPLVEDKDQTNYNKKLASILPPHNVNSSYGNNPLPTERDYRDFVDKLNNYCKDMKFSYGPMYEFEYEPEEGMSNDGWGHEYPNFRIYDTQGNLDMFSDDNIVKYIRDELEKKGWYPEAVHSSSDFTIAVE